MSVAGERERVRVAEAFGDRGDLGGDRSRSCEVSGRFQLEDTRHEQIAALDTVLRFTLEQPLRPSEPSTPGPHIATQDEVHPDPEGAPNRA